jgi:hypothetical protein
VWIGLDLLVEQKLLVFEDDVQVLVLCHQQRHAFLSVEFLLETCPKVGEIVVVAQYAQDLLLVVLVLATFDLAGLAWARYREDIGVLHLYGDIAHQAVIADGVLSPALKPSEFGILLHFGQVQFFSTYHASARRDLSGLLRRKEILIESEVKLNLSSISL